MLYGPSKKPRTDGTTAAAPASELRKRRAPRITPGPDGGRHPRTVKFVEATARRRSENHARPNRHRPPANHPGVRRSPMFADRNRKHAPTRRSNPSAGTSQERRMISSCPYNDRRSAASRARWLLRLRPSASRATRRLQRLGRPSFRGPWRRERTNCDVVSVRIPE